MGTFLKLLTDGAFTALILGAAKLAFDYWEKKKDRGQARIAREINEVSESLKSLRTDLEAAEETDRVLLHDRIWQSFRFFSGKEEISVEDRANIDYLYEEYKKKGGNHKAKVMYEYIKTIPVTPETVEGELEHGMDN